MSALLILLISTLIALLIILLVAFWGANTLAENLVGKKHRLLEEIVTHGDIGRSLLDTAVVVLGSCPLQTETLGIPMASDPEQQLERAQRQLQQLEQGDGVLILTDLYGSTPSNIACKLCNHKVTVVTGLNLPMLIRVLNYPNLNLDL